jgi:hypothetical protein
VKPVALKPSQKYRSKSKNFKKQGAMFKVGMHPGYPANLKTGYRISGAGRIPDIRPDF